MTPDEWISPEVAIKRLRRAAFTVKRRADKIDYERYGLAGSITIHDFNNSVDGVAVARIVKGLKDG